MARGSPVIVSRNETHVVCESTVVCLEDGMPNVCDNPKLGWVDDERRAPPK